METSILEMNQEEVTAFTNHEPHVSAVGDKIGPIKPVVCAMGGHLLLLNQRSKNSL